MPVSVVVGDLTRLPVDAIVNAANTALAPGGGVCGAIFAAAGYGELDRACRAIGGCSTGQAVLTPGFALPAKYIIHTAGPIWHGGGQGEAKLLRSCYDTSLCLAQQGAEEPEVMQSLSPLGYRFQRDRSDETTYVFCKEA